MNKNYEKEIYHSLLGLDSTLETGFKELNLKLDELIQELGKRNRAN